MLIFVKKRDFLLCSIFPEESILQKMHIQQADLHRKRMLSEYVDECLTEIGIFIFEGVFISALIVLEERQNTYLSVQG